MVFPVTSTSTYPYTVSGEHPSHGDALETFGIGVSALTERVQLDLS